MNTKEAIKILRELTTQDNFLAIEGIIELLEESKIIVTLEKLDKRLKKVERLADDNWRSIEYLLPIEYDTKETYNGKPISEIKVGGTD